MHRGEFRGEERASAKALRQGCTWLGHRAAKRQRGRSRETACPQPHLPPLQPSCTTGPVPCPVSLLIHYEQSPSPNLSVPIPQTGKLRSRKQ